MTTELPDDDLVVDVRGFVDAVTDVTPYSIAIAGIPWSGEGDPPIRVGSLARDPGSLDFDVHFRARRGTFEHRFIASLFWDGYQLISDIGVTTHTPENIRPTRSALDEFGARVALFAAYPFIREALTTLAVRFELDSLVLPVLKQGSQAFESDGPRDEVVPFEGEAPVDDD